MTRSDDTLNQLLERHIAGEKVAVPESLADEFEQALAGNAALRDFLDGTVIATQDAREQQRNPPQLPVDYKIERELGHGGMGVVYLARQQSLNRDVAIKVLRPNHQTFRSLVDRFLHEAQHLARLRHPHIVAIHEIGDADGEPYFTMDYVDGEPLTQRLSTGPLSPTQSVELFKQIASAVQHAHKHGIVHRDLKPANILLNHQGHAFVTDFGLARQIHRDSALTQTGEVLGTPQYMAPEQARGEAAHVGEATDIHALGLLLYEMLTGRPAFQARSPADLLVKLLHHEPDPPRRFDRRIPRDLETICLKCLQKDPAARYANVGALLEDLRRYEAGEPLKARHPGWFSIAFRWSRRHWKLAATAGLAAAVSLLLASQLFNRSYEDLVAWGDEELATGNARAAAQVYSRAWTKGTESQQRQLIDRIVQTCRLSDRPAENLDLALKVVELDPTVSFGARDYLIAQALVSRERAADPSGAIDIWHARPSANLKLVRQRLELALEHGVPEDRRMEAEETLAAVKLVLAEGRPDLRFAPDFLYSLPKGTAEEFSTLVNDESQALWTRGKAAMALGRQRESDGNTAQAIAAYESAFGFFRKVYPYYSGVSSYLGASLPTGSDLSGEECRLVADLCSDLARLEPNKFPQSTGGIEFSLDGAPIPADVVMGIRLILCDVDVANPDEKLPHRLPRITRLNPERRAFVGVLDGRYRLTFAGNTARWTGESGRFMGLMQIETDHWPAEVTIQGNRIQLPPAHVRLAEEIQLSLPKQNAILRLHEAEFRWQAVPQAAYYQVRFLYSTESPQSTTTVFAFIRTEQTQLRFDKLEAFDRKSIAENLLAGRTGGWSVTAYDAQNKRVGVSLEERRFLVAEELTPK
ncbi:MAG: serine/threonine protein kinase [Planctomycetes bacterium]|nr:serine/threonine protein kinase [Planctomycetota bacterium]